MDAAIWVAFIGSVATVGGALGTQAIGARTERRRAEREDVRDQRRGQHEVALERRRLNAARLDELRGVLDDAAQALTRGLHAFNEADHRPPRAEGDKRYDNYVASLHDLWNSETRLAVRLGNDHPAFKAYGEAAHAIGRPQLFFIEFDRGHAGSPNYAMNSEAHKTIQASRREAFEAQKRFHVLAAALVGPELTNDPPLNLLQP